MKKMASSVASLHCLGQDDQNELKHKLFGHETPLALTPALHGANGIINGTTTVLRV